MSTLIPSTREMIAALISTPSMSSSQAAHDVSNRGVIELLAEWSASLGFETEIQTVSERKFNLIARAGRGGDGLVLSGHSDTVPCNPARWTSDPFAARTTDTSIFGLGSCDMKSFLALALTASSRHNLQRLQRPLTLVATADEESTMNGAKLIADNGSKLGRFCVIGEPTSLVPVRQHKGALSLAVDYTGQSGHASDPSLGNNALDGMHQFMTALYDYRDQLQQRFNDTAFRIPTPTMNLGHIHGGDSANRICGDCCLFIDIRYLPAMSFESLLQDITELAVEIADSRGLQVSTRLMGAGLPPMDTDAASEIAEYLTHLTGKKSASVAFATEAPYFNSMQTETIVFGPGSIDQAHQPDEFLPLAEIDPTINILEQLITRFCQS